MGLQPQAFLANLLKIKKKSENSKTYFFKAGYKFCRLQV
jgi:hypothetical protein